MRFFIFSEISLRRNFHAPKIPGDEYSRRRILPAAKIHGGEKSHGENSRGENPAHKAEQSNSTRDLHQRCRSLWRNQELMKPTQFPVLYTANHISGADLVLGTKYLLNLRSCIGHLNSIS